MAERTGKQSERLLWMVGRWTCRHSAQRRIIAQLLKVIIGDFQIVCNDWLFLYDSYAECREFCMFSVRWVCNGCHIRRFGEWLITPVMLVNVPAKYCCFLMIVVNLADFFTISNA